MTGRWVVIDSSLVVAYLLPEALSPHAKVLLQTWQVADFKLAAPALLQYEVVAVFRKQVYRGLLTPADALSARDTFLALLPSVQLVVDADLLRRGYELAAQLNRPTAYDSQYLAVAERLGCEFWTADERLWNATRQHLAWVRWLGQATP